MKRAILLPMIAALSSTCLSQTTQEAGTPQQEIVLINARLASKDVPADERMRLAMRKNKLVRDAPARVEIALPVSYVSNSLERKLGVSDRAPVNIRVFLAKCEDNKRTSINALTKEANQLAVQYKQTQNNNAVDVRQKRVVLANLAKQATDLNRAKGMLVRNDILTPPFIVDKTLTKQTLMAGMIGKTNGLFVKKILSPTSALVNFCVPRLQKREVDKEDTRTVYDSIGVYNTTTRGRVTISEQVIDEPDTQDVVLDGIDTATLYDGAVYEMDFIVEITGLAIEAGKRTPKAKVVDIGIWIQGNDFGLPDVQVPTTDLYELSHKKTIDGQISVSVEPMRGIALNEYFVCQFYAAYRGQPRRPQAPVSEILLSIAISPSSQQVFGSNKTNPTATVLIDGKETRSHIVSLSPKMVTLGIMEFNKLLSAKTLDVKIDNQMMNIDEAEFRPALEKLLNEPIFSHNMPT